MPCVDASSDVILSIRNLSVGFTLPRPLFSKAPSRRVQAVDDVSFDVPRGSCFGIVGESGSGKSTLARAITGLVQVSAGEILLDEQPIQSLKPREKRRLRRRIQMVLQDPRASLDPRQTVYEVLREALIVHGIERSREGQRRRIAQAIRQVGLNVAHLGRYSNELSGGQRQRVAIARAIICEPEIVVLDEPVSALDVSVQAQIINLLVDLQETLGLTYLFITHDLALVSRFADAVGVMYLGRFVEHGPTRRVCDAPAHPYTDSLLSIVAQDDPEAARANPVRLLEGQVPSPLALPTGCAFHTRCLHARTLATHTQPHRLVTADGHRLPRLCVEMRPQAGPRGGIRATPEDCLCHFPLRRAPAQTSEPQMPVAGR
ncbi:oligopeptide/dipeptide ABC transporter ATP-binding protein [Halotalea alkalilenta]|uniref:oligopeptide/dipeptide ABC transporter ATP-binding protein n=1 Tax=Halotalea alkalilenta TaxID=376489 RepID=UPI0006932492|nr:ABC transporter ATP-binding protein [Halotalea alkalilenta]